MLLVRHILVWGRFPRLTYLDVGVDGVEGKLKADLVIALASAAVRNKVTALLLSSWQNSQSKKSIFR